MNNPEGCPECGDTRNIQLLYATPEVLRKKCVCKHEWLEERKPDLLIKGGWVNNKVIK